MNTNLGILISESEQGKPESERNIKKKGFCETTFGMLGLFFRSLLCSLEENPSVALLWMWKSGCGVCFSDSGSWSGDRYLDISVKISSV